MKILFILLLLLKCNTVLAFDLKKFKLVSCYDGDTCKFNILDSDFPEYLNPMSIRVYGVDTPEIKGDDKEEAIQAREFTMKFIENSKNLKLINCKKDKYFRFDCEYIDGEKSLSNELIKSNLGIAYFGGKKSG